VRGFGQLSARDGGALLTADSDDIHCLTLFSSPHCCALKKQPNPFPSSSTFTSPFKMSDRKDRIPSSPTPSSTSRGNVVDHHAPHGMYFFIHTLISGYLEILINTCIQVTEELPAGKKTIPQDKSHMLTVQPLKRSEMQACRVTRYSTNLILPSS